MEPTFPSLACRLDALDTTVHAHDDLGVLRVPLMRQVSRARVALGTAAARCDPARPRPARRHLRRVAKRLAALRRRLRSRRGQRVVPQTVAIPLRGDSGRLVDDARTIGSALRCS
jgi:hypothetical protein